MIAEEGAPRLRGRFALANYVLGHRRLRHFDVELEELTMDTRSSPEGIRHTHLPNEVSSFLRHFRPPGHTAPTFPGPIQTKPFAMPGNYGLRFDDCQRRAPTRPQPGQPHPEHTIGGTEADTPSLRPSKDHDLLPQGDDLCLQSEAALEPGTEGGKNKED